MIGAKISRYQILSKLGGGGMGVVYEAQDTELGRRVAIKVLPEELARDVEALERFKREARAASALEHPHICVVHDVGTHEGQPYLVMERLRGRTLRHEIGLQGLPIDTMVSLGVQIADGLEAAHRAGIVHRDLKPENLFVTERGEAKILDFGLAKVGVAPSDSEADGAAPTRVGEFLTAVGSALGTVAYMSPEQARGRAVDTRSDLFSFGVVLYEMATGRQPYTGGSVADLIVSVLLTEPRPPRELRPDLPVRLEELILKALEKDPALRYQSATELRADLLRLKRDASAAAGASPRLQPSGQERPPSSPSAARGPRRRARLGAAAAALLATAGLAYLALRGQGGFTGGAAGPSQDAMASPTSAAAISGAERIPERSIAVLPFVDMSPQGDQEYFSDGLSEELLNVLAHVPQLRVISRTSSFQFKGKNEDVRTIGRRLNVANVLEGSVRKSGERLRITAQLVDTATGSHRWSETYDRQLDDVFRVQDEIAGEVVRNLEVLLVGGSLPARPAPRSTEAYTLVLQGRFYSDRHTREDSEKAVDRLRRAVALDPEYAVAWAELSRAYVGQAAGGFAPRDETIARARDAAQKALGLDPTLASAHLMLGYLQAGYDLDWRGADLRYRRALELDSGSSGILANAGMIARGLGRLDESIDLLRRAIARDPLQALLHVNLAISLLYSGKLDEAEAACRLALDLRPKAISQRYLLGRILLAKGELEAAREAVESEPDEGWRWMGQAIVYHALGRQADSDAAIRALTTTFPEDMPFQIAEAHAFRGEVDAAFDWLERARELRDPGLVEMKGDPLLRSLEGDPRYPALLRELGLPEA